MLTVSFGANDVIARSWTGQALSFKNIDGYNECRDYLDSIGATRTSNYAVYQGELYTPELVQVLKENGYVWGRSTHFGVETNLELGSFNSKVRDLQNMVSAETAISYVTDAIDTGNTVIFMNHHITEDDSKLDDPLYWKAEWLELCAIT